MTLHVFHDFYAFFQRRPEVGGSFCKVRLKKIIGPDPYEKKFLHQFLDYYRVIVHPLEEDRLTAQGNAGISKSPTGKCRLGCDLRGMVEMGVDIKGMEPLEDLRELWCHPLGQGTGDPGSDANDLHMGD